MTYSVLGFDVGVHYHDTDIDERDCFGCTFLYDTRVVVTIGRAL